MLSGVHAVVLGFGAHNGCPGTNGQPTVWLEPLGAGSIIPGTCARTQTTKAEPGPFIVRNGRTCTVTFEVDRHLHQYAESRRQRSVRVVSDQ
ncbi:MAG: hypothetical protein IPK97_15250 [Ahniella sp.]|nr:hypothetical protein [Ahniella sp.]